MAVSPQPSPFHLYANWHIGPPQPSPFHLYANWHIGPPPTLLVLTQAESEGLYPGAKIREPKVVQVLSAMGATPSGSAADVRLAAIDESMCGKSAIDILREYVATMTLDTSRLPIVRIDDR